MSELPWNEKVPMLSMNPDAADRHDIAELAADLMEKCQQLAAKDKTIHQQAFESKEMDEFNLNIIKQHEDTIKVYLQRFIEAERKVKQQSTEIERLKAELSTKGDYGYSQEVVDALTKERDELKNGLRRLYGSCNYYYLSGEKLMVDTRKLLGDSK